MDLPDSGIELGSLALQADSLPTKLSFIADIMTNYANLTNIMTNYDKYYDRYYAKSLVSQAQAVSSSLSWL